MPAHRRDLKLNGASKAKLVYLRREGKIDAIADIHAKVAFRVREEHAFKAHSAEAHAQTQVSAAADGGHAVELCALNAHEWLGIAAAIGLELLKRAYTVHVERRWVGYLDITIQRRQLLGLVFPVVAVKRLAEFLQIFTANI